MSLGCVIGVQVCHSGVCYWAVRGSGVCYWALRLSLSQMPVHMMSVMDSRVMSFTGMANMTRGMVPGGIPTMFPGKSRFVNLLYWPRYFLDQNISNPD